MTTRLIRLGALLLALGALALAHARATAQDDDAWFARPPFEDFDENNGLWSNDFGYGDSIDESESEVSWQQTIEEDGSRTTHSHTREEYTVEWDDDIDDEQPTTAQDFPWEGDTEQGADEPEDADETEENAAEDDAEREEIGLVRASELIGLTIINPYGEEIAEVYDIVLDAKTGTVRYAALYYGGFLGLGEKVVAVDWTCFRYLEDEDGQPYLMLDATEEELERLETVDRQRWPLEGERIEALDDETSGAGRRDTDFRPTATDDNVDDEDREGMTCPYRERDASPDETLSDQDDVDFD